jgi:hypothetical protein
VHKGSPITVFRWGLQHKSQAATRVVHYGFCEVECFDWNMAARAVGAHILDISPYQPILRHHMFYSALLNQQEEEAVEALPAKLWCRVGVAVKAARHRRVRIHGVARRGWIAEPRLVRFFYRLAANANAGKRSVKT